MLDYLIVGLPRSGTTWLANWLTTERSLCTHDPLYQAHYSSFDYHEIFLAKAINGISCTGLWRFPEYVNNHPGKKIIIHRPIEAINASMRELSLPLLDNGDVEKLENLDGTHLPYEDLWNKKTAEQLWSYLIGNDFDQVRWQQLQAFNIQPEVSKLCINPKAVRALSFELTIP